MFFVQPFFVQRFAVGSMVPFLMVFSFETSLFQRALKRRFAPALFCDV